MTAVTPTTAVISIRMTATIRNRTSPVAPPALALLALAIAALLTAALALAAPATADAARARKRVPTPRLVFIRCSSVPFPCNNGHSTVTRTGQMLVGAGRMTKGAKVIFRVRYPRGRVKTRAVGGRFRTRTRLVVRVPRDAISGLIRVVNPGGKPSNAKRIVVKRAPKRPRAGAGPNAPQGPTAFDGNGMWIWYLSRSHGGDPDRIAAKAKQHGVDTIFVKSADAGRVWSQFTAETVAALKATGLRVCGWQFVYGSEPIAEARAGAWAKEAGADCFVIDAEGHYEGRYAQAQRYVRKLRELVGPDYPVGLTSFPYVDYHPSLPYSVFLGPGAATFNLPQVYWKTIGDPVDRSLAHTYQWNIPYKTPIYPLGQAYDGPRAADIRRFRQLSAAYGARGVSWWVWQFASNSDWNAIGAPIDEIPAPPTLWPTLRAGANGRVGSRGDLVVWAQQHLVGAGASIKVDGQYGPGTANAVRAFQRDNGLPETGVIDADTWPELLKVEPVTVDWVARAKAAKAATARAASAGKLPAVNGPASASLRAKRYEIPPGPER